jgi:hypothetical protein
MQNLFIVILCIFAAMALLVAVTQRYGKTADDKTTSKLQQWIVPLVGLLLVLSALEYFMRGS